MIHDVAPDMQDPDICRRLHSMPSRERCNVHFSRTGFGFFIIYIYILELIPPSFCQDLLGSFLTDAKLEEIRRIKATKTN